MNKHFFEILKTVLIFLFKKKKKKILWKNFAKKKENWKKNIFYVNHQEKAIRKKIKQI